MAYKNFDEFWKANEEQIEGWEPKVIAALAFSYGEACGVNYALEDASAKLAPLEQIIKEAKESEVENG